MSSNEISPDEAARALSEVAERRRQVAEVAAPVPAWYFPLMGALTGVLIAWMDVVPSPYYMPGAVVLLLVYAAVVWAAGRAQSVKPHWSLYGVRGWLLVAGLGAVIGATASVVHDVAAESGIAVPNTVTGVVVGVLIAVLGTASRRWLRRIFVGRSREAGR